MWLGLRLSIFITPEGPHLHKELCLFPVFSKYVAFSFAFKKNAFDRDMNKRNIFSTVSRAQPEAYAEHTDGMWLGSQDGLRWE